MSRRGICGSFFKKTAATGLVLVVFLAGLSPTAAAKIPHWSSWSRVQTVPLETRTDVLLYEGEAPPSSLKIKGRFHSATADTVTLTLKDGQARILQKAAVHKVLVRRPFKKRTPAWGTLGVTLAILGIFPVDSGDPRLIESPGSHLTTTLPIVAGFFCGSRMKGIYKVPPKHRTQLLATS